MKRALLLVFLFITVSTTLMAQTKDPRWKEVEEHLKKRLPQSAIAVLTEIETGAKAEKRWAEAARAMGYRISLLETIDGSHEAAKIRLLDEEIPKAPSELHPILQGIQAKWFWDYFSDNEWRFLERTQTDAAPGKDIETWDLKRLFAEIDRRFQTALAQPAALQAVPVSDFDALLDKGTLPDAWRPTLYDFIVHEALDFYTSGEQAGARPQDAFSFNADSPALAATTDFLAWKPETTDADSAVLRAIGLYQALLRFHEKDADPAARVLVDLDRLDWAHDQATGEPSRKNARLAERLEALLKAHADHEISLAVSLRLADLRQEEDEPLAARALLQAGADRFPKGVHAPDCRNRVKELNSQSLTIETESVWNAAGPDLAITSRNVPKVWLRLYRQSWNPSAARMPGELSTDEFRALVKREPAYAWSVDLPGSEDLKSHVTLAPAPFDQKPGFYILVSSAREDFAEAGNQLASEPLWISPLALVTQDSYSTTSGWVFDALSGEPKAGATVTFWAMENNRGTWKQVATVKTNEQGSFERSLPPRARETQLLQVKIGDAELASTGHLQAFGREPLGDSTALRTFFFTDRAIYRPGQTVSFKGIHIRVTPGQKVYTTMANVSRKVTLRDPNGEEVGQLTLQTNDKGSFSGSFAIPRGRGTGSFTLRDDNGSTRIQVEEYKRPKFHVTLEDPAEAPKLGETVRIPGKAEAYTGAPIDGAGVSWRVTREPRWPSWLRWAWWFRPPTSGVQEIAHGTAKTGIDGTFTVDFTALPDLAIEEKANPWFVYQVTADVTDAAGETRSGATSVTAGYTALEVDLSASEWQVTSKPTELTIITRSLGGTPEPATGEIVIHRLKMPTATPRILLPESRPWEDPHPKSKEKDLSDPNNWDPDEVVQRSPFTTDAEGLAKLEAKLAVGEYRAVLTTKDRFGKPVTSQLPIRVLDPEAQAFPIRVPFHLAAPSWSLQPGEEFTALWGTGYGTGTALIEIEHAGKILKSYRTGAARTQEMIRFPVTEELRGGFTLHVVYVRENRAYLESHSIGVPWTNKELTLRWETLRSKIEPGSKEKWSLVVTGPDGTPAEAELVATLYDASLDAFLPHYWPDGFEVFPGDYTMRSARFHLGWTPLSAWWDNWDRNRESTDHRWRSLPGILDSGGRTRGGMLFRKSSRRLEENMMMPMTAMAPAESPAADAFAAAPGGGAMPDTAAAQPAPAIDLGQIAARANLNETAFFYPQLTSNAKGEVTLEFTMPEALTKWRFLGFAHDTALRGGLLQGETVTAKDLMVQPNPPRFLREGDVVEFTVKITNQSDQPQQGKVRLTLSNAESLDPADAALGNTTPEQAFNVPAKESRTHSWRLTVPDGQGFLSYKAVAGTGKVSDGEEGFLPVLPRRILVTESMTLPIRNAGTKTFTLDKLLASGKSSTLRHQSLTAQVVSQPAWYAVMSLPYLMEYPHECSEQTFNRLYANVLARHLATGDPKIRRVFDLWRDQQQEAIDSPLLKNEDLKSLLIEETPWLRDARKETAARHQVGVLFDDNRLQAETTRALDELEKLQLDSGAWPWFPGGRENDFITLYLVTGFGRLGHLGVTVDDRLALRALDHLDAWITERHQQNLKSKSDSFGSTEALYLYGRSFFLERRPVAKVNQPAVDYFLGLAKTKWTGLDRMSQAQAALGMLRFGDKTTPPEVVKSLLERSVSTEEMGRFWRDTERSWWWYRAPIETQAMMIEAFREISQDAQSVEDCQVWLLKQKQTQAWPSTKSTADAIYGLLLGGENLLASSSLVTVSLAGQELSPEKVEAGTGFYEHKLLGSAVKPEMGTVKLTKTDQGVSWGSLHWQYFEDMAKVTPHEGNPLNLKKALFLKVNTKSGPQLREIKPGQKLKPGDELVTRVELRTDRDMEFVHLKDQRGSGTEPVNVLSGYRFQDGMAYYESTRDTASHFFIDYLPKGTYVFESSVRVQLRGTYQSGIAEIQCLYAPEFNSHSGSVTLDVE